jgi:hypothetical protein
VLAISGATGSYQLIGPFSILNIGGGGEGRTAACGGGSWPSHGKQGGKRRKMTARNVLSRVERCD